jgi:hypothetical protein
MHTCQRPDADRAGSFEKVTGLVALGPPNTLVQSDFIEYPWMPSLGAPLWISVR